MTVSDIYGIFKIAQVSISAIFGFIIVFNPFVTKLLLRNYYIAGEYKGISSGYLNDEGNEKPDHIEFYTIIQNVFETFISGQSFREDSNELIATWEGKLVKTEGNTFYFAMELSSRRGEFGTLKLSSKNETEMVGFYYSGNPENKNVPNFIAKKISKKEKKRLKIVLTQNKKHKQIQN